MRSFKFDKKQYLTLLSKSSFCAIREDAGVGQKVKENLLLEFSKSREGIHATDLTLCMRQCLYRKLNPMLPTTRQVGYFIDGARRHETLQKLYGQGIVEREIEFEGVKCTIDILDNGIPIEFKSTRASNAISEHWVRQLIFYMLAVNSVSGILQIQRIMQSKGNKNEEKQNLFPAYLIELNQEQREAWLEDFRCRRQTFFAAYQSQDITKAPVYRGENSWLCVECQYKADCDKTEGITS